MSLKFFDLKKEDVKWKPEDYFTFQLHDLKYDENGIGVVTSTQILYDCRVLEVDENSKISRAIIQRKIEDEKYEQNTLPLKKVESLSITNNEDGAPVHIETYSPIYRDEIPQQRYLFSMIAGARNEEEI